MRSFRAQHNLVAVSALLRETAINTEKALDTSMLVALSDIADIEPRRESNVDELTGKEEADTIYDLGGLTNYGFNFPKAQPQHFAFLYAYGLGSAAVAAAGSGYQHTLTPITNDLDSYRSNPSFTLGQRYGQTIMKRLFASMFIDSLTATFAKDQWCKITAQAKGTGKKTDSITHESITASPAAVGLTLAANAVAGTTAAERLDSVHRIIVELVSGVWTEVVFTAVSAATPAVITIEAPAGAGDDVTYKVLYAAAESAWMTFPARTTETPLRVSQLTFSLGGKWNGGAVVGGREMDAELDTIEHTLQNNMAIEFIPGAGDSYASRAFREGRNQMLRVNREFREFIFQQHIADNDTFAAYILAEGAIYDDPHKYQVELIFPKLGLLKAPISVNGKRLAEAGDFQVMQDATYGSVICKVKNLVATYAA